MQCVKPQEINVVTQKIVKTVEAFDVAIYISIPQHTPRNIASKISKLFLFSTISHAASEICRKFLHKNPIKKVPHKLPKRMVDND